jgi:hypothetical protein
VVSYFDSLSTSNDSSSDDAETLLFRLRYSQVHIEHLNGSYVVSVLMTDYSTTCAAEMRCQLSFYGEVNASISVVSYFDSLSKFEGSSLYCGHTAIFRSWNG